MREINQNEMKLIVGGFNNSTLLNTASACIGGYLGSYIAYFEPFMTFVGSYGAAGSVVTYTPNTMILLSGVMLSASIAYAISSGVQQFYFQKDY